MFQNLKYCNPKDFFLIFFDLFLCFSLSIGNVCLYLYNNQKQKT